jgi:hypothetical protein
MASPKKKPRVVIDLEEKHRGNEPDEPWWCASKRGPKTTQWADRFTEYMSVEEHESATKKLQEEVASYKEVLEYYARWHSMAKDVLEKVKK